MTDQKALFSALKKCNQIGKKLSYDGTYIMVSGMMMGYTWQDMDETEARGLCVSFIESKLLTILLESELSFPGSSFESKIGIVNSKESPRLILIILVDII